MNFDEIGAKFWGVFGTISFFVGGKSCGEGFEIRWKVALK